MQKIKKVVSALAAGTMLASMTAFSANAADEATIAQMQSTLDGMAVAQGEMSANALAIAQTQEMLAAVENSSETYYYPYYDKYVTSGLADSQHYIAVFPSYGKNLPTGGFGVYLYSNANILPESPRDKSHIKIGSDYVNGLQLNSITVQSETQNRKRLLVNFGRTQSYSPMSTIFTYKLGGRDYMSVVSSEYDLYVLTNPNPSNYTTRVPSTVDGCTFPMCVYARADVNRDGQVTADDSQAVLSYLVNLAEPYRGDEFGGCYDKLAFELAADFDGNGKIEITDVVGINRYINGLEEY